MDSLGLLLSSIDQDSLRIDLPDDWGQGRASYGGLVAALALRALKVSEAELPPLRTVNVAFVASATGSVTFRPRLLRRGRYVTQMDVEVVDASGALVTRLDAVFGAARTSALGVDAPKPETIGHPEDYIMVPEIKGITPRFLGQFDMRLAAGAPPFTGQTDPTSKAWVRLKESSPLDEERLLCIADVWWSPALALAKAPVPASSIRWSAHFTAAVPQGFDDYLWAESHCIRSSDGYVTQVARFWTGDTLAVWSEQSQAVFG
ncbi:MAG: thioesterase family protein [Myxococcota bacterium]